MDTPVNGSLQEYVLGALVKRSTEIQKLPIPRFGGRLVIRYGQVPPRDLLRLSLQLESAKGDEVDRLLVSLADALLKACQGTETDKGDDLGKKLGTDLADYLGVEPPLGEWSPEGDREAVFVIFDDDVELVKHANQLRQVAELAQEQAQGELVGNSGAVGS
jgi:hypothetical protein